MTKDFCDQCGIEFAGERADWKKIRVIAPETLGIFCSFNCLYLWAYERSLEALAKADMAAEPPEDIYGPDSGRRNPELLMEAADMERKARLEG